MKLISFGGLPIRCEDEPPRFAICLGFNYADAPGNFTKLKEARDQYQRDGGDGPDTLILRIVVPEAFWPAQPDGNLQSVYLDFPTTFFPSEASLVCSISEVFQHRPSESSLGMNKANFDKWLDAVEERNRQAGFYPPRNFFNAFPYAEKVEEIGTRLVEVQEKLKAREAEIQRPPEFSTTELYEVFKRKGYLATADYSTFFKREPHSITSSIEKFVDKYKFEKIGREWRFDKEHQAKSLYDLLAFTKPRGPGRPKGNKNKKGPNS